MEMECLMKLSLVVSTMNQQIKLVKHSIREAIEKLLNGESDMSRNVIKEKRKSLHS